MRKYVQTVVEILAESPGRYLFAQTAVGGRNHAYIQIEGIARAEPLDFALLQYPQQLGLQRQRNLGYLIQQQRAALGLLEFSRVRIVRTGECAALPAEQHRFEHVLGNRRTIDGDEGVGRAAGMMMDVARQHFLAGAGFTRDQHRAFAARDAAGQRHQQARALGARDRIVSFGNAAAIAIARFRAWHHR